LHGRRLDGCGLRRGSLVRRRRSCGGWRRCGSRGPSRPLRPPCARLDRIGPRCRRGNNHGRGHGKRRWAGCRGTADREALGHHVGQVHHVRRPRARGRRRRRRCRRRRRSRRGLPRMRRCGERHERGRGCGAARQASGPILAIVHDYVCSRSKMNCSLHAARFSLDSPRRGGPPLLVRLREPRRAGTARSPARAAP
jgi:hypothetical protein